MRGTLLYEAIVASTTEWNWSRVCQLTYSAVDEVYDLNAKLSLQGFENTHYHFAKKIFCFTLILS